MTNTSKLWVAIGCILSIGSVFFVKNVIGLYVINLQYSSAGLQEIVIARMVLLIGISILSYGSFFTLTDKTQTKPAAMYIILGLLPPICYMWTRHEPILYLLTVTTPACLGIGTSLLLSKNKIVDNINAVVISVIILLVASSLFVLPNPNTEDSYPFVLTYNAGTSFIAIIATIMGSIIASHQHRKKQITQSQMDTEEFISTLTKLSSLKDADMLNEEEFNHQKDELIKSIIGKNMNGDQLTFLAEIAKLKQRNVLTNEDIDNIKAMVVSS